MTETLLLVPGLASDARAFSDQILEFNDDRPVMLAPVVYGGSIARAARDILDAAPAKFSLFGHGLGAILAMDIIRQGADRVSRVALMSCTPLSETPQEASNREPRIVAAQAGKLDRAIYEEFPLNTLAPNPISVEVQAAMLEMARRLGPDTFVRQSRMMQRRPDQQNILRRMKMPALILCGSHDRITPPRRHEFMAELIPNATLEIIEEAGHLPHLETPIAVNAALRRWLDGPSV